MEQHAAVEPVHEGDHVRGAAAGAITLIEYGDYDCPHTRAAQREVDRLLTEHDDVRIVFRHFPLRHLHPNAELLAHLAEGAAQQGKFWPMHDHLMAHDAPIDERGLVRDARATGVDVVALRGAVDDPRIAARVEHDVARGKASGVHSTPTFFFDGELHDGHYDYVTLSRRLAEARARAAHARSRE